MLKNDNLIVYFDNFYNNKFHSFTVINYDMTLSLLPNLMI